MFDPDAPGTLRMVIERLDGDGNTTVGWFWICPDCAASEERAAPHDAILYGEPHELPPTWLTERLGVSNCLNIVSNSEA
jgi:hypothetical protein